MKTPINIALAASLLFAAGCASRPDNVTMEVSRVTCSPSGTLSYDVTIRNDGEKALVLAEWAADAPESNFSFRSDLSATPSTPDMKPTLKPITLRPAQSVIAKCSMRVKGKEGRHYADISLKTRPELNASLDFELVRDTTKPMPEIH